MTEGARLTKLCDEWEVKLEQNEEKINEDIQVLNLPIEIGYMMYWMMYSSFVIPGHYTVGDRAGAALHEPQGEVHHVHRPRGQLRGGARHGSHIVNGTSSQS